MTITSWQSHLWWLDKNCLGNFDASIA